MEKSFAQVRLSAMMERSGLTDTQIATILGVNQSTVSRLKSGLIQKVAKYHRRLDSHLGLSSTDCGNEISDLVAMATLSPALRDALVAIQRLMRENA